MRKSARLLLATACLGLAAIPAQAAVTYDFIADSSFPDTSGFTYSGSFSLTTASYVTTDTSFAPAQLNSCSIVRSDALVVNCGNQDFLFSIFPGSVTLSFGINSPTFTGGWYYYFNPTDFSTPGLHETIFFGSDQHGFLNVSGAVPEPASWAMMLAGFGALGAALRRRHVAVKAVAYA